MAGQPRRSSQGTELAFPHPLLPLQKFITYVAFVTIGAQFIFLFNLFWSMKYGEKASDNPWEATTLEWTTATQPPHDNFGVHTPAVYNVTYQICINVAPPTSVILIETATNVAPL